MEFHTFYDYFLYTKSWAYVMMFVVLPAQQDIFSIFDIIIGSHT